MTAKIFRYVFMMGVLVLFLSAALILGLEYSASERETVTSLKEEAIYAANGVGHSGEAYLETLSTDVRITWIAADGSVLFDSSLGKNAPAQSDCPEVAAAFANGEGSSKRRSESTGKTTVYYAVLCRDGTVLRLCEPTSTIWKAFAAVSPLFWITVLVLFLAGIFAYRAAKQITGPINAIEPDRVEAAQVYPELSPLVNRIREQNLTIGEQMEELQRRQKEFAALTENMNEGFVMTDRAGIVLSSNTGASRMIPGCEVGFDLKTCEEAAIADAVAEALDGERVDRLLQTAERVRRIIISPIFSSGITTGTVILAMDVTETAQRERLRREFSANVSHELKTPLTSISGFAELMMQDMVPAETQKEFAGDIYRESQRLILLINDIIKLSKLDEQDGLPEKEPVDLYALASRTLSGLESYADSRNVKLRLEGQSVYVEGSPAFLDEMLYNLCDNAIKYNKPEGGSVTVTVHPQEDGALLAVRDTGIGIPYEAQNRIFERFYRVSSSRSQDVPGTGLGLSIVKHAAQLHGAKVDLESVPGMGTTISLLFPKSV